MARSAAVSLAPPPKASKKTGSSPERVAAAITSGLRKREYSVGQRLVETDLTERLGVSRSTVREALKILASKGVVEIIPHRGAAIRGLTLDEAEGLLQVLEVLTVLAARLAAQKIGIGKNRQKFIAAAKPLVESDGGDNLQQVLDERARFYQAMLEIADNEDLNRSIPAWRAHLFRNQFYAHHTKSDMKSMRIEYRNIVDSILAGDTGKAELYTQRHLQKTRERMLPHLR